MCISSFNSLLLWQMSKKWLDQLVIVSEEEMEEEKEASDSESSNDEDW